jgi:hypothetical protein
MWWHPLAPILIDEGLTSHTSQDGTGIAITGITEDRQVYRIKQALRDLPVDTVIQSNATTAIIELVGGAS